MVNAVIALLTTIWGTTYFVIREGLEDIPPFSAAGIRFALAAFLMAALARVLSRREGGTAPGIGLSIAMGVGNFAISYGIVYWAEQVLTSGLVSVLWAVFPMMIAACGHIFIPGERLYLGQWGGFVVGFIGVVVLFMGDLRGLGPAAIPAGAVTLLSPAAAAVGQTIIKRYGQGTNSLMLNRNGMLIGAALLAATALIFEGDDKIYITVSAVGSVAYLTLFGTVVTFGLYFWVLRYAPSYKLSLIAYLTPILALTVGAVLGDEPVGVFTVLGTVSILGGVALVSYGGGGMRSVAGRRASDS